MKCYIIDTLIALFAVDDTGTIINFRNFNDDPQKAIEFFKSIEEGKIPDDYIKFLEEIHKSGFREFIFDNKKLEVITTNIKDYQTIFLPKSLEFKSFRLSLDHRFKSIGINLSEIEILQKFKSIQEELTKYEIKKVGTRDDIIVIQIIESLDIIKKSISLLSSRMREWYGLHFPELTDKMIEDNIVLANIISKIGARENYSSESLSEQFEFSETRIQKLLDLALNSMGSDIDIEILQGYTNQIDSLDRYRTELEKYLDQLMEKVAPNMRAIVGSLVSAKLIAKAGSLEKLAFMPASRIQLLGAEKALYRFLKTGEKRPKHGLIFQWNQIRSAKPYHRGKIARMASGKIGLASKLDFFDGDYIGDKLMKDIEEKIKEIEIKYPKPPPKKELIKKSKKHKNKLQKKKQ
jgi:nucleolar protein 56